MSKVEMVRIIHPGHCSVIAKLKNVTDISQGEIDLVLAGDIVTLKDGRTVELMSVEEQNDD